MTWQDHIDYDHCKHDTLSVPLTESRMKPGLTGIYDQELREKASVRAAPLPPEYMGLEGEYDPTGLVRRVAQALDQRTDFSDIEPLTLAQQGSTIVLSGRTLDESTLAAIVETVSRVDGTRAVDVEAVTIAQPQGHRPPPLGQSNSSR